MSDDKKSLNMQYLTQRNVNAQYLPSSRTVNKGSETTTKPPTFQFIPHDELVSLFEQNKGTQYFIPEGFEPILIPRDSPLQPVANLLQNGKNLQQQLLKQQQLKIQQAATPVVVVNSKSKSSVQQIVPSINGQSNSDVRFPQLVLARTSAPTQRAGAVAKAQKPKKPPRPPNAFILYRRSKQPDIVARNEGISNNEVSKQVGEMWHKEPLEEKLKFQQMADAAKLDHMKKYPEYKYRPRRPHEKRRRTKRPSASLSNNSNVSSNPTSTTSTNKNNVVTASSNDTNNNNDNECGVNVTSPLMDTISTNENDLSFLQIDRRSSIDTVSSVDETSFDYLDESRRSSLISVSGDMNEIDFYDYEQDQLSQDHMSLFGDVSQLVDEPPKIQYPVMTSSDSHDYNVCVDSTFNFMMEGVSPGNDSEVNPYEFFDLGYQTHSGENFDYLHFNTFDLNSLIPSPDDQMMCEQPVQPIDV
jgi:hypothetical protein